MNFGTIDVKSPNGNVTLMWIKSRENLVLCDTGFPWSLDEIEESLKKDGYKIDELTHVILTHHDCDHMGCAAAIKRKNPKVQMVTSEVEKEYVEGNKISLRLQQAERVNQNLKGDALKKGIEFCQFLKTIKPCKVDCTVKQNFEEIVPNVFGIFSPGHMPGHLSVLFDNDGVEKILYVGDSLVVENGEVAIANPHYTLDINEAKRSISNIKGYEIDTIVASHGGVITGNINERINKLGL